jgi:hypothetical protein
MENGMSAVTVNKLELLNKLMSNRETHKKMYDEAYIGFRKELVKKLERMTADAVEGKPYMKYVGLDAPEDHTKEYDRIISMLQMSVNETIIVTEVEFNQFVLDEWNWKGQFAATNALYTGQRH